MNLEQYLKNSWIQKHAPSPEAIRNLLAVAEREIRDAGVAGLSPESAFFHAYTGVLSLATVALHAAGYKVPKNDSAHYRTLECLPLVLGDEVKESAKYFDFCRRKRHKSLYEMTGNVTAREAEELLREALALGDQVRAWLAEHHPHLSAK